jgi:hypothetical protein
MEQTPFPKDLLIMGLVLVAIIAIAGGFGVRKLAAGV